jgi:hypothetical protein
MGGVGVTEFRPLDKHWSRLPRRGVIAVLVLGPLLAGCASPSLPSFSSMFGSGNSTAANANAAATPAIALPSNFECPTVNVRSGASTLTSSAEAGEPTATSLRYQVGISNSARECRGAPGNMVAVKVGIQGRVILGPQGSPGTIDVPIRYAVVFESVPPRTILTKLERVSVTVPPGESNVLFSHVVDALEFPMPKASEIDSYVVYLGFDPIAAQEMDRRRSRPPAKPPRRQSNQVSQVGGQN